MNVKASYKSFQWLVRVYKNDPEGLEEAILRRRKELSAYREYMLDRIAHLGQQMDLQA